MPGVENRELHPGMVPCNLLLATMHRKEAMMSLNRKSRRKWSCWQIWLALALAASHAAYAASPWERPAAQLAAQVAEILGAGQAQLVVNNKSTIEAAGIQPIRSLLEQDLHTHGITISGTESANLIRVTLSENTRERLWIAEVIEGNQTQVTMVHVDREALTAPIAESGLVLEKKRVWSSTDATDTSSPLVGPVLAALEIHTGLILLEQEQIVALTKTFAGWHEDKRWIINQSRPLTRDPRGLLLPASDGNGFLAIVPGRQCDGSYVASQSAGTSQGEWTVHCRESDDPWPVSIAGIHAFYNPSRNFFTGVITPNQGIDLAPFYTVALLPHPSANNPALLMNGVNGKVQLLEGNALKPVFGARDWGSDFAVMRSTCGAGTQIIASASGETQNDSLRAYELPGQQAVAVSTPLNMDGTVTALWPSPAPDLPGIWVVVRKSEKEYEVDRVTALCS